MIGNVSGRRYFLALSLAWLFLSCCGKTKDTDNYSGKDLLNMARDSIAAINTVSYKFEYAFKDSPVGWAKGEVISEKGSDLSDIKMVFRANVQMSPNVDPDSVWFSSSGNRSWLARIDQTKLATVKNGEGDRGLKAYAMYGLLPEFYEKGPFWKELQSGKLEVIEGRTIGKEACYSVFVTWPDDDTEYTWYISKKDFLPRGMSWKGQSTRGKTYDFLVYNLQVNELEGKPEYDLTKLELFSSFAVQRNGEEASGRNQPPKWEISDPIHGAVSVSDYEGKVLVMAFWNTWCGICKRALPIVQRVKNDFENEEVVFLGMNVFEMRDPSKYWDGAGYDFRNIQNADTVAKIYDLPWQPGFVVLDRNNQVIFNQWGAPGTLKEDLTRVIRQNLP